MKNKINLNNVNLRISAGLPRQFPRDPVPQVAFSGRSNVGKSSLINALLGRKSMARVSGSPGKTITVNFYDVDGKMFLTDLPGYGYAKRTFEDKKKWSALTDGYFTDNKNIDLLKLVVQLVDSRVGTTKDDDAMIKFLNDSGFPYIVVATKIDKLNKTEMSKSIEYFASHPVIGEDVPVIMYSSVSGTGKAEIWDEILNACDIS